ncbi:MAG: InlB B-repeat-containing protein [Firmicutes bacterium]|nr:InlB B-repeat-containing protein [Bacillota bacterium]
MKKRNLIALLMAVCMMFSLLPVNAIAVGDEGTIPAEETLLSENGNDPAPAGSTNPAGDKDSIPGTGEKPSAAEEPVKDEESAKDEEPGKDEEPAEDEEGGKTNVVPMRVVRPDTDKYLTYVFRVDGAEVSRQIVKKGDTLYQPVSPVKDGYKFTGWFVGASELAFGTVGEISESAQINVDAGFTEVLYVFFADTNGRIVHTKEGVKGDVIKTDDVTYGLENTTHAITGWYLEGSYQTPVDSVTLDKENITVYAKVEPGHWLHFDSDGGTYIAPQFYSATATTAKPNVEITKPGYTFSHWEYNGTKFEFGSPLTENITLKARWNAKADTQYTVIHWQEDADDDGYSYVENETLYGTTGAQTSARAKTYNGFTVQAITQETIKGNGATIVNIYYTRNVYEVKFYRSTGSSWNPGWSEITNNRISAKYGANIRDQWPGGQWKVSPSGSVYQTNIDVMPLGGTNFYETSQYNGSAKYYLEDLNGNYVLDHTDTGASTTATISKEDRYNITGFTVNESKSGKDGERYNGASFYYDRNSYNVVYISHGQTVNTASYKYQQSIADAGDYNLTTPPVGMEKYIFAGWCADPFGLPEYVFDGKTMPAQNITVYAYWAAPTVSGVAYITMEGTGGKNLTIPYGGTIDEGMLPDPQKPAGEGWTFAGWATKNGDTYTPFHFSTKIYENIELYPYYTNKSSYTVTYTDGKNTVTDMKRYAPGAHADVQANSFAVPEGKVFLGWAETAGGAVKYQPNDKLRMDASVTLYAVWGDTEGVLSLVYMPNGGTENAVTEEQIPNNSKVTLKGAIFTRPGYTLTGWNTAADGSGTSFALGAFARVTRIDSNVLYAQWKANNDTAYKVEFYCEQTDGNYTLKKTEPRTGTTDATVSVTDGDKAYGTPTYVYDADNANNVESGPVAADGTLTLKLYFKRNTAEYTIHHYLKGTEVQVAPDQTGTMTIGDTLTASASTALGEEYTSAHVDSYSPSQSLKMKATGNVITVYYTVPLTITAESASRAYNAQPLTQPDFKVEGLVNGDQKKDITLSMTKESTITNVGSVSNVIDTTTVRFKGGALPGGYYELPTYQPGTLTITPNTDEVTVTITGNHDTRVYNGSEQSVTGYTTDVGEKTITVALKEGSKAEAKGTNAGKYEMGLTKDNFTVTSQNYSNIKVVVVDGYLKIDPITDKVTVTVTEKSDTVTYDGKEHTVTGYKSISADNTLYDVTTSVRATETEAWTAKGKYVGTYHVGIEPGDFKNISGNFTNVEFVIVDGDLVITPASVAVVKIAGNTKTVTYNGEVQSVEGYTVTSNPANATVTLVGQAIASGTDAGTYPMGLKPSDFTATSPNYNNVTVEVTDGYLEIDPITDKVTVTVTEKSGSAVYNGQEHSVTGYETMTANNALYDVKKNVAETQTAAWTAKGTDVGKYPVGIVSGDFANTSKNFTNVVFTVVDGALTISPISEKTITVTAASGSKKYDGTPLTNSGFSCTEGVLVPGDVLTAVVEGSATNVGDEGKNVVKSYKVMRGGADVTGNYTFANSVDGKLTILPRTVTLSSETASKEYDGAPLTRPDVSVTGDGFVSGEVTGITATGSVTYVSDGTVENTITYTTGAAFREENYDITKLPGKLSITQSSNAIVITTASKSREYNGKKLLDNQTTHTGTLAAGDRLVVEFPADAGLTDVGTKRNEYKSYRVERSDGADVTANYTFGEPVIGTLTVTPVAIELTANSAAKAYDGTPLTDRGYTISNGSFVGEEGLAGVTVEGSQTAVGSSANTITGHKLKSNTKAQNYNITYADGTLTVSKNEKVITVTANSRTWEYDGKEHSDGGYTVRYDGETYTVAAGESQKLPTGGLTLTATVVGTVKNVADSAKDNNKITVVAITDAAGNVVNDQFKTITLVPGTLTITKRGAGEEKVILEAANNAVVYDGQPHGVCLTADGKVEAGTSYTITYLVDGHSVETVITGSRTEVGKYPGILVPDKNNTHIVDGSGNDVTDNYEITYRNGDLEIVAPGTVVVEIKGIRNSVVYDGSKHEVNGYTVVSISNRAYTRADFSLAEGKSAHAEGTNVGEYYMNLKPESFVNNNTQNFTSVQFVIVEDGLLEITPITDEVTVTITGKTATEVYNGSEQSVTGFTTDVGTKTIDVALKEGSKAEAKGTDVDTYYMGLTKDSFSVTSRNYSNIKVVVKDGWLKIDPIADKVTVTVTENSAAVTYDGTEHSVTGYKSMTADNTLYDVEKNVAEKPTEAWTAKGTYVGTYHVGIKAADFENKSGNFTNVEFVIVDGDLVITPASVAVVKIEGHTKTVTYNGKEQTVEGYTITSNPANATVTLVGKAVASGTDANTYPMGLTAANFTATSPNYEKVHVEVTDGYLKINPITDKVTVTVTEKSDTVVYDTNEHSITGYKSMTANNALYDVKKNVAETQTAAWTAKGTDVGEYPVGIEASDFENTSVNFTNVEFVVVDGALNITPAENIAVKIAGSTKTVIYDGTEQTVEGYTVTSNPAGATVTLVGEAAASGTDANTYPMGLKPSDFTATSPNYKKITIEVTDGWLKIDPIADKVTVTVTENSAAVTYDGTEHSVTGYKSITADNTLYDVEKNVAEKPTKAWTAKGTDAGEYPVGIVSGDFRNTSKNFTNVEFVIVDGTLKIDPVSDKVTVTITENADTVIYDTKEHSVKGYKSMTADNALYDVKNNIAETSTEAWTAKGTDVGEYPVGIKADDFENTSGNFTNVEFVIVDGALKIAPAESIVVKIAGNTKTVTYNGEEQSVEGYTVTSNPANADVTLVGKAVAAGTDADTYPMGLSAADFTATSPNYETVVIEVKDGWLKINPVSDKVTVTVTEKSDSVVYDGQEHSVTGYETMAADNALYNTADVAETPTDAWTAKGTNAGKYQVGIKSGDFKNTSVNFTNVAFVIVDGELEITPVTDKVIVTVVEKSATVTYDGKQHSITGYESMTADNALYDITNVAKTPTAAWTAKGTEAGEYPVGIVSGDFKNTSKNFANVEFVIVDGALTITTDDTEVVVTVTGNTKTVVYDGTEHSVEGYTVDVNGLPITVTPKAGTAAKASGTNAGTYYMGLTADDFTAESNNYSNIRIVVTDGWLKIDPITDKVTVTVTENADTVEYDGKEHSVTGYASIVSDHALYDVANVAETPTDAWTAKGTDAGTYPVGIKSGDFRNTSGNFTNVEFVIVDGELVITRRGENPGSPVTLRADDSTVMFDGDYHGYVGHIATNLAEGHSVRSVKSDFTARNVGRYEDKIDLHDAIIVDADGKDVTRNYVLTYQPGTLEITPFEGEVVVTVTGNTGLFRYDGKIHTVEGYTLEATVPFFTEDDIRFTGDATISEVRPGDYVMNLKDEEFSAANDNFTSVKFVVIDGSMRIYTVRYTVAWMFDTDQMLTGDSPNRYFTSMANYIDRSDISLVLHTGNVVADAGAQSQWDVFNNAMQPLYDDEEVDVLMIAAEKEAASGSLFLQQPVREDFKEEDLFENGKGFVRRFNIGEKSVILVGLGADAMTEEGYKWAREKFNSDKDASGILLVNNYLLEDMRKPDKIDERALDLEKNVVKACSNVRMVLSSSGGYSSHYEFYYGERKVIAINSDIEAAAKAGYFTQLTFNEDLNILSVTNLCPYTYDFVYNERQAYKECYVLNNVL